MLETQINHRTPGRHDMAEDLVRNCLLEEALDKDIYGFRRQHREDITQHEIAALKTNYNLADAHTHQKQSAGQRGIVANLPALWYQSEQKLQAQSEQDFISTLYEFNGQYTALTRRDDIHLVYAASIAMHIVATYLMKERLRVGVIEPCFDNLPDLLKHMQVPLTALDESIFHEKDDIYDNLLRKAITLDAILLVDPNNPTGFTLMGEGRDAFAEVIRFCCDYDKVLILDFCFAAFLKASGKERFDVYEMLEGSGVKYLAMEDTGKIWPLQDAKCAALLASRDLEPVIYPIVTSVLLNVSPFILNMVRSYINESKADGFASVSTLLHTNRQLARRYLSGGLLEMQEPLVETSVAWFRITDERVSAQELFQHLLKYEVYLLTGRYFYWCHPERGERFIRIALARDTVLFEAAMKQARKAINDFYGH